VSLQIAIRESGDVTILDLSGRSTIDGRESELLSSNLRGLMAHGVRNVLLNLTDLTQVDSSSVTLMVKTYRTLRVQGGDLKLLRPRGHVLDVFRVLHLLKLIPSFENEVDALASFQTATCSAKS